MFTRKRNAILWGVTFWGSVLVASPSELLFVVMGGRTSCDDSGQVLKPYGVGLYPRFQDLVKSTKSSHPELKVRYVITCFDTEPPPNAQMPFVTSEEPQRLQRGNAGNVMNVVESMENLGTRTSTILIGHSYGGFLGMYFAERLRLKNRVALLATVDPISNQCGPWEVVIGSQVCHEAPRNLRNDVILNSVGQWLNFYQTSDDWVNSGPISEAKNFFIGYRGPHSDIDTDNRTWKEIRFSVESLLR